MVVQPSIIQHTAPTPQTARPITVAFLLQDFTTGGISQWIYTLCRQLHKTDPGLFTFHFVCTHGWVIRQRFYQLGIPVFLGREGKAPNWTVWLRVKRYLRRLSPDIVVFSNLKAYRDICFEVRPPVIIERKAGMRTIHRYDSSGVDAMVCQNRRVMDAIEYDPAKKFLVYHGVDLDETRSIQPNRLGFSAHDVIVGQVSRIGRGQNQRLLIDAVLELRKRHPQVKMVLVGGTTPQADAVDLLPELREYAKPLGDHVRFTGDVEDSFPAIAGFTVATCTGTRELGEGAPRKLIEPMAFGIPCVTTDSGATNEVVDDGVNGFVIEDNNVGQLVERIERLMLNRTLYQAFSDRAREKVERVFNIQIQAQKLKEILLTLLARSGRAPQRAEVIRHEGVADEAHVSS